ncbi:MAG: hypothetical protein JO041_11975 [Acidobacteria bacterium]|nr:hypothetical protein [Acidobacteriota bacterium]
MRTTINLATQPYQDIRTFALRWGIGLLLLLAAASVLVYKAVEGWRSTRDTGMVISRYEDQMKDLQHDINTGKAELQRPENVGIRMQSAFLNTLIARKAFSWTEAFSTLEDIMPPRLHVVSMQPELDDQNRLILKMRVVGDSRDGALMLLRRMENTPEFQSPQLESEAPGRQGQEEFQIAAIYVPAVPSSAPPAVKGTQNNTQPAPAQTASARPGRRP